MAAITTSGRTASKKSVSRGTSKSGKASRGKSLQQPRVFRAQAKKDGKYWLIRFRDGQMTQGLSRPNALIMAADLRACIDGRSSARYYAKWHDGERISVVALP